ncbi:MAG: 30S ribosomal protein S8 [bacterium]|nr:30S ribosomal protein S8 [bacterium]
MTDPIADMLNRIRNAQAVSKKTVDVPFSQMKAQIAKILEQQGLVEKIDTAKRKTSKMLEITLKYADGRPEIAGLKRISKPGLRVYRQSNEIRRVKGGYGIAIFSTSKGIMTDKDARKQNVGGEVLCELWR